MSNFRCRTALNVAEKPTVAKSVTQFLSGNFNNKYDLINNKKPNKYK